MSRLSVYTRQIIINSFNLPFILNVIWGRGSVNILPRPHFIYQTAVRDVPVRRGLTTPDLCKELKLARGNGCKQSLTSETSENWGTSKFRNIERVMSDLRVVSPGKRRAPARIRG